MKKETQIIAKYEFTSKAQFQSKWDALHELDEDANLIPKFRFSVFRLGNIVLAESTYDEEGVELTTPILSDKYHVDAVWFLEDEFNEDGELIAKDHPYGWKSYSVDLDSEGLHSVFGVSYLNNKF